jgi:hypothetical protein
MDGHEWAKTVKEDGSATFSGKTHEPAGWERDGIFRRNNPPTRANNAIISV